MDSIDNLETIDICILIPKDDEFQAHLDVFAFSPADLDHPYLKDERYPFRVGKVGELVVALVCMQGQGNTAAADASREILTLLNPAHMYLSGTALGNPKRATKGAIRTSDYVDHLESWTRDGATETPRLAHYQPPSSIRKDVGSYISQKRGSSEILQRVTQFIQEENPDSWEEILHGVRPDPEQAYVITDNRLERTSPDRLWSHEERAAVYDMESGGFARVVSSEQGLSWVVIRSVSDFGSDKREAEHGMRRVASLLAASFAFHFIRDGISRSHPRAIRPLVSIEPRLSPDQHYSKHSAVDFIRQRLREDFAVSLPVGALNRELALEDIALHLREAGYSARKALDALEHIRVEYFNSKYLNYDYGVDLRGYFPDYWIQELREILAWYGFENLANAAALDVGCGNGLEFEELMSAVQATNLTGVDISAEMLDRAKARHPEESVRVLRTSADRLDGIPSSSVDVYLSLRTYMSRFFNVDGALRQAYRVLRPGGVIIISIANGYLETTETGEKFIVPGLKDVNGSDFVNPDRPFVLLSDYHRRLRRLGFQKVHVLSKLTDVYLGAEKPGHSEVPLKTRLGVGDA